MPDTPEPAEGLAEARDEQQVAIVEQTDNRLTAEDAALEQPPQDPDWRPPS